tara:strand:- start:82 stop:726 length:645 start_codon:yes stop_codon:yes gene_type:complete
MDLTLFKVLLSKLKQNKLAGRDAHSLMAPPYRMVKFKSTQISEMKPRMAAVLLLLYPNEFGEMNFVLTRRRVYNGMHSGQISFPGGKPDPLDNDLWATALRETYEEIGILPDEVIYIRNLSKLYVPPSNFLIIPYLGYLQTPDVFKPDPREVEAILEISLMDFINKESVLTKQLNSNSTTITVPAYIFDQNVVWGATAMILSEFKMLFSSLLSK